MAAPANGDDFETVARRALFKAHLRAVQRHFKLLERVPPRFVARGWELDDRVDIAMMALCFVAMRMPTLKVEVFRGANDPPCWASIVGATEAGRVVEALELGDLIR